MISVQRLVMDIRRGARGRPKAPFRSTADMTSLSYLVRVSKKYEIDTIKFLECIHSAWVEGERSCGDVSIRRRERVGSVATFLISRDERIIAQLRLTTNLLEQIVRPEIRELQFEDYRASNGTKTEDLRIKDLNGRTKRFNLDATVTEKTPTITVLSKWGDPLLLSTATITDKTGTMKLPLWRDQTTIISVGDLVRIENARLKRFRGELQVQVDRLARLQILESQRNKKHPTQT